MSDVTVVLNQEEACKKERTVTLLAELTSRLATWFPLFELKQISINALNKVPYIRCTIG